MIFIPHNGVPATVWPPQEENRETVNPYPHEVNITDGSEFLDDAIRTKDQPLGATLNQSESGILNSEF